MAILIEIVFILAAIIGILSFFTTKDKKDVQERPIGVYKTKIEIDDVEYQISSEVELIRDYGDNDTQIKHNKIFGLRDKDLLVIANEILEAEHSLISKEDVKWKM